MSSEQEKHPAEKGLFTTWIGVGVNLLLAIVKFSAGIFGNSFALIADAVESAGDVFTSAVMYIGLKVSAMPADRNHPYGHGKAEPIAAIVVVLGLVIAAAYIIWQAIHNLMTPDEVPEAFTLAVLLVVILLKEGLARYVKKVGVSIESRAVKADAFHHRSDAISSAAAFVGITIALIGGEGYEIADDIAALVASVMILINAYYIARPAFGELMDEKPEPGWIKKVNDVSLSHPEVESMEKLRVKKLGFDYYLDFHLRVNGKISVDEGHRIAHEVKDKLMNLHPYIRDVLIHIEPAGPTGG